MEIFDSDKNNFEFLDWDESCINDSGNAKLLEYVRRQNQLRPVGGRLFGNNINNEPNFVINFLSNATSSSQDAQVVPKNGKKTQNYENESSSSVSSISFVRKTGFCFHSPFFLKLL